MSNVMGEHPSPEEKPVIPKSSEAEIDTSAIKPGPAADNPKPVVEKPKNTDEGKAPEPPANSANPNTPPVS